MKKGFLVLCLMCVMLTCVSFGVQGESEVFFQPSGQMNIQLAKDSAMLCDASYYPVRLQRKLTDMGFKADTIVQKDYETDALHSAAVTMARKTVTGVSGETCTVYVVVVRGTNNAQEMISNFEVGNGDISSGFRQAAERAYAHWLDYVAQYPPEKDGDFKVWVCGHSRGAAVANLLAGEYMPRDLKKEQIYGYTFATPNVQKTVDVQAPVFNFIMDGDVVTRVPPAEWGFQRHGTDIHYDQPMVKHIAINSREDTDRLLRTFIDGGLTQENYRQNIEPILAALGNGDKLEDMNYTMLLLPILQNIDQSTAEDRMNLPEMMRYTQNILPSHTVPTYIAWLDGME